MAMAATPKNHVATTSPPGRTSTRLPRGTKPATVGATIRERPDEESPADMQLRTLDLAVLVLYVAGVVGLGCWFVRRSGTTAEFMKAGGSLPSWAVGLSLFGTFLSSITFLGVPGKAYAGDWNAFVFSLTLPPAAWLAVKYFVPFYRRRGEISAYEHFEQRFGGWAQGDPSEASSFQSIARSTSRYFESLDSRAPGTLDMTSTAASLMRRRHSGKLAAGTP